MSATCATPAARRSPAPTTHPRRLPQQASIRFPDDLARVYAAILRAGSAAEQRDRSRLRAFDRGVASLPGLGRRAQAAEAALQARRHDQRPALGARLHAADPGQPVRRQHHRRRGAVRQAGPPLLRLRPRPGSAATGTGCTISCTSPRASTTTSASPGNSATPVCWIERRKGMKGSGRHAGIGTHGAGLPFRDFGRAGRRGRCGTRSR